MAETKFVEKLKDLMQLDYDAIQAYEEAIERIEYIPIRQKLENFKKDHERHVAELSRVIANYGGTPPEHSRDLKGFMIEGMTSVMSVMGIKGALTAMKANEKLTNAKYKKALELEMPIEAKEVLRRNYDDERRHLEFIEHALEHEVWKQRDQSVSA